jgi:hypothetical protein
MRRHRNAVEAVARRLLERLHLSGEEIQRPLRIVALAELGREFDLAWVADNHEQCARPRRLPVP